MKSKFLTLAYVWLFFLLAIPIASAVTLAIKIPGAPNAGSDFKQYVLGVYNFGRMAVGITAFGVIVYAALEYTASAGNTARQEDARSRIKEAIMGIVLLFGATILFNLINPDIIAGSLEKLNSLKVNPNTVGTQTNPNLTEGGKLTNGNTCDKGSDCASGSCQFQTVEGIKYGTCQ
ncbi:MAG: hypothetical protein HYW34_03590 [Candidatus Brennerbacteria bacterium]|nr:hypothetical protein [Candidatus Brennerbacteria bacterium]